MESTREVVTPTERPTEGSTKKWIALLGRREAPTDGIEDYCSFLGEALARKNIELRQTRIAWAEKGWVGALRPFWVETANWSRSWVLLQYTTMSWSRRGFSFGALAALAILRCRGVRCAVVFHEPSRQNGRRWIDLLRGSSQDWIIRRLYAYANKAIFLDPLERIRWLPDGASKAAFIPIGANIPEYRPETAPPGARNGQVKTVAVFCLSDAPNRRREIVDIAHAMRFVAQQGVNARVVFLGRGTTEAREEIEELFDSTTGEAVSFGLQSADEVRRILSESDAMLCVRGPLCMRRGSAIAGVACGLPLVGYAGEAEGTPLEEAGVKLVPYLDRDALGRALAWALAHQGVLSELKERSLSVQRRHFSWDIIAAKMLAVLGSVEERART
jgi:glycosyltransferase involved in cell wall biosynthesis